MSSNTCEYCIAEPFLFPFFLHVCTSASTRDSRRRNLARLVSWFACQRARFRISLTARVVIDAKGNDRLNDKKVVVNTQFFFSILLDISRPRIELRAVKFKLLFNFCPRTGICSIAMQARDSKWTKQGKHHFFLATKVRLLFQEPEQYVCSLSPNFFKIGRIE